MGNFIKSDPSGKSPHAETHTCPGCINRVSTLQKHKQTNSFALLLGVFVCHSGGERLSREGKQTDSARPVDHRNCHGGGGLLCGRSGGEAERGGRYRCEPQDKRESFRNRIMASCLSAPQIVCQVTAALNRDVFI